MSSLGYYCDRVSLRVFQLLRPAVFETNRIEACELNVKFPMREIVDMDWNDEVNKGVISNDILRYLQFLQDPNPVIRISGQYVKELDRRISNELINIAPSILS